MASPHLNDDGSEAELVKMIRELLQRWPDVIVIDRKRLEDLNRVFLKQLREKDEEAETERCRRVVAEGRYEALEYRREVCLCGSTATPCCPSCGEERP